MEIFGEARTEDAVEALQEDLAIDEVKTLASRGADVVDDEVDRTRAAANRGVQGALRVTVTCQFPRSKGR